MAMRFHLDEHVDHDVARGLRSRGIDVTTSTDAALTGVDDEGHLLFARQQQRIIVTHDADFLRLHGQGCVHAGIVYCAPQCRTVSEIVRFLCLMHDCLTTEEMQQHVEYC